MQYGGHHRSDEKLNPGFKRGVRVCSNKDGVVKTLISRVGAQAEMQSVSEGVMTDAKGNVYRTFGVRTFGVRTFGVRPQGKKRAILKLAQG